MADDDWPQAAAALVAVFLAIGAVVATLTLHWWWPALVATVALVAAAIWLGRVGR